VFRLFGSRYDRQMFLMLAFFEYCSTTVFKR
jgi:hypothetical protein